MDSSGIRIGHVIFTLALAGAFGLGGYVVGFRTAQPVCDWLAQVGAVVVAVVVLVAVGVFVYAIANSRDR